MKFLGALKMAPSEQRQDRAKCLDCDWSCGWDLRYQMVEGHTEGHLETGHRIDYRIEYITKREERYVVEGST
jgi:hypothetical protein